MPPPSTSCCKRSSIRCASLAARLSPMEAAEPLMRWEVIKSSFSSSSLPPPSMASSVSVILSSESSVSSTNMAMYFEAVSISSERFSNMSARDSTREPSAADGVSAAVFSAGGLSTGGFSATFSSLSVDWQSSKMRSASSWLEIWRSAPHDSRTSVIDATIASQFMGVESGSFRSSVRLTSPSTA